MNSQLTWRLAVCAALGVIAAANYLAYDVTLPGVVTDLALLVVAVQLGRIFYTDDQIHHHQSETIRTLRLRVAAAEGTLREHARTGFVRLRNVTSDPLDT